MESATGELSLRIDVSGVLEKERERARLHDEIDPTEIPPENDQPVGDQYYRLVPEFEIPVDQEDSLYKDLLSSSLSKQEFTVGISRLPKSWMGYEKGDLSVFTEPDFDVDAIRSETEKIIESVGGEIRVSVSDRRGDPTHPEIKSRTKPSTVRERVSQWFDKTLDKLPNSAKHQYNHQVGVSTIAIAGDFPGAEIYDGIEWKDKIAGSNSQKAAEWARGNPLILGDDYMPVLPEIWVTSPEKADNTLWGVRFDITTQQLQHQINEVNSHDPTSQDPYFYLPIQYSGDIHTKLMNYFKQLNTEGPPDDGSVKSFAVADTPEITLMLLLGRKEVTQTVTRVGDQDAGSDTTVTWHHPMVPEVADRFMNHGEQALSMGSPGIAGRDEYDLANVGLSNSIEE